MLDIKETLIDLLTGYSLDTYEDVQYVADELIAKGVLPVVRCKDCVFCSDLTGAAPFMYHYCRRSVGLSGEVKDDDYCSYGERKEAE